VLSFLEKKKSPEKPASQYPHGALAALVWCNQSSEWFKMSVKLLYLTEFSTD